MVKLAVCRIGDRFGSLTITAITLCPKQRRRKYHCRCDCGADNIVRNSDKLALPQGQRHPNCADPVLGKVPRRGKGRYSREDPKVPASSTRLYTIWKGMRQRCQNPRNKKYSSYGGRGISVCEEWQSFDAFRQWALANGYDPSLSIDRWPDNDGNYEPGNCRWATASQQMSNQQRQKRK